MVTQARAVATLAAEMARLEGHDDLAAWLREREDGFKGGDKIWEK
mgnify:CR=1 FL=1